MRQSQECITAESLTHAEMADGSSRVFITAPGAYLALDAAGGWALTAQIAGAAVEIEFRARGGLRTLRVPLVGGAAAMLGVALRAGQVSITAEDLTTAPQWGIRSYPLDLPWSAELEQALGGGRQTTHLVA